MNNFVIIKKFDNLGRIVIPIEVRKHYGFEKNDEVQIIPQKNGILLIAQKKTKF
ncbi:MAG: AbrB/MazE/SpoVT family DNA-binding domain-containing protein [Clostridia bacterium]|nr:AbrB/MazE/SpoVT family DNA-binding domain-containing protein [Clostridia bacterium]